MIFKLIHEGVELDTHPNTYFEMTKGSIFDAKAGLLSVRYSSNIELPASHRNIDVFKAHRMMGGRSSIIPMVAVFNNKVLSVRTQLVSFDDDKITIYIIEMATAAEAMAGVTMTNVLSSSSSYTQWKQTDNGTVPSEVLSLLNISFGAGLLNFVDVFNATPYRDYVNFSNYLHRPFIVPDAKQTAGGTYKRAVWSNTLTHRLMVPATQQVDITSAIDNQVFRSVDGQYLTVDSEIYDGVFAVRLRRTTQDSTRRNYTVKLVNVATNNRVVDVHFSIPGNDSDERIEISHMPLYKNTKYKMIVEVDPIGAGDTFDLKWYVAGKNFYVDDTDFGARSVGWGNTLVLDFLKSLAMENGQYLKVDTSTDKLVFQDLPSLDTSPIVDLSEYYVNFKSASVGTGGLKARNNLIQYSENLDRVANFINIRVDEELLNVKLEEQAEFKKLAFSKERSDYPFTGEETASYVMTVGGGDLLTSLPKFQIYADIYAMTRQYSIELRNINVIPESIFYVKQLNGLFVPTSIIETTKNKLIVKCYKLLQS